MPERVAGRPPYPGVVGDSFDDLFDAELSQGSALTQPEAGTVAVLVGRPEAQIPVERLGGTSPEGDLSGVASFAGDGYELAVHVEVGQGDACHLPASDACRHKGPQ